MAWNQSGCKAVLSGPNSVAWSLARGGGSSVVWTHKQRMNKLLAVSRSNHRQVGALSLASGLVAVMLWFCSAWSGAGGTNLNWRWSNPAPHGNNIQDLVYLPTNGVTLQVCEFGQAYYSYDNYNWSTITKEDGYFVPRNLGEETKYYFEKLS